MSSLSFIVSLFKFRTLIHLESVLCPLDGKHTTLFLHTVNPMSLLPCPIPSFLLQFQTPHLSCFSFSHIGFISKFSPLFCLFICFYMSITAVFITTPLQYLLISQRPGALLFQDWAIGGPFLFPDNLRISWLNSLKTLQVFFFEIALTFLDYSGSLTKLTVTPGFPFFGM